MKLEDIKKQLKEITDDISASKILPSLAPHMAKLNQDDLLYLFKTEYFPIPRYRGLIYLIEKINSDKIALLLLNLVEKLPDDYLNYLFLGDQIYTGEYEETDNLMRQIHIGRFSASVVTKALKLLGRIPPGDLEFIMISDEGGWVQRSTPLEMIFDPQTKYTPEEKAEIAIAFIDTLSQSDSLRELLINAPRRDSEPFLHQLARQGILPAIAHYLENPKLKIDHTNYAGKTALERAPCGKVVSLFKAQPLRKLLLNPNPSAQKHFKALLEKTIQYYPGVLETRWGGNKTLAHIAVEKKKPDALELLLRLGADANAVDGNQLSILDYAINTNQPDAIIILAAHPKTVFSNVRSNGTLPLPELFGKCHFTAIEGIINNLTSECDERKSSSFAATLPKLPKPCLENDQLKQVLGKPVSDESFAKSLSIYCNKNSDSTSYFVLNAGGSVSTSKSPVLLQAALDFTKNHLSTLANTPSELEKESRRLQLILFLFAMSPGEMSAFLKQLSLNEAESVQLDLTICHALTCPLIYSSLSEETCQKIMDVLHDKKRSMKTIADTHFRHSTLAFLPHKVLQTLSHAISKDKLYQHNINRKDPILVVLTLNRLLMSKLPNNEKITVLLKKLEHELALFNANPSPRSTKELTLILNLATSPVIQDTINNFLTNQPATAPIIKKIDTLFTLYRKDQNIVCDGMLQKIFFNYACKPEKIQKLDAWSALRDVISTTSRANIQKIIKEHQQYLQEHLLASSLLRSIDSSNENPDTSSQYIHELYKLEDTTARISLTPFVNNAVAFSDKIRSLVFQLETPEFNSTKQSMETLALAWSNLADAIIKSQFENTFPAWTDSLESSLLKVQEASRRAVDEVENLVSISLTTRIQNPILQQLMSTIHEQGNSALPEALKQGFKKLDDMEECRKNSLQRFLAANPKLHLIQNVLTLPATSSNISELGSVRSHLEKCLQQQIKNFNYSLSYGISKNAELKNLLPDLSAWQMSNGIFVTDASLIKQIPGMLNGSNHTVLPVISEQQDAILGLLQKSDKILRDLEKLASTKSSLSDLLDILYASDFDALANFILLTAKSQAHDLNRLAHFVLNGKKHHWDSELLKKRIIICAQIPLDSWLSGSIKSLTQVAIHALSIKIIIASYYLGEEHCEARLKELSKLLQTHKIPLESGVISLLANSYATLLTHHALSSNAIFFIEIFSILMQQANASLQAETFASLTPLFITQLLEHVLVLVNSNEPNQAASSKFLLTFLSQQAGIEKGERLLLIKKRLGAQDFKLLGNETLTAIAKEVLAEKGGLDELTYDGVWIQRLLVSPQFVASSPPETLQNLTNRYRALSRTLKQDEFDRLNNFITGKLDFAHQHREAALRWREKLLANPEERTQLLEQRERLLMFRADDCIRALYNHLEDNCFELRELAPELAETALNTLYTHHNQQLASMRTDGWFRMANFVYTRAIRGKGDLPMVQNPLLAWMDTNLPHHNFQQAELKRKTGVKLYNENREKVGFLDESNHAKAIVNDLPVSLLEVPGWKNGSVLYNKHGLRIGILTANGQLKRENVFQEETSALLVGKMPIEDLEKSPAALELLLKDICNENALTTLYKAAKGKEKQDWLHKKLTKSIQENEQVLSEDLVLSIVEHHPIESLMDALENSAQPKNAANLFKAILKNDEKRDAFLSFKKSQKLGIFFTQVGADEILADFLKDHHSSPWFTKGLKIILKSTPKTGLLANALKKLSDRVKKQALPQSILDSVLNLIITTPVIASAVLEEENHITRFFKKQHIMPVIKSLLDAKSWANSAQYKLVLEILNNEHAHLFPVYEANGAAQPKWNAEDLQDMTAFAKRLIANNNNLDAEGMTGHRLLGELVFRCAGFGQTALFYKKNGKLNADVAGSKLQRSTLDSLAAKYYFFNCIKESYEIFIAKVRYWFGNDSDVQDESLETEIKDNPAAIDWKAISKAAWSLTTSTELPLIAAFLINYSGDSASVYKLIRDILKNESLVTSGNIACHLSQIMSHYPHRDISHVIFKALIDESQQKPKIIDKKVLDIMVNFHAYTYLPDREELEPLEAELSFLTQFGLQKQYALTGHIAKLLYQNSNWYDFILKCLGCYEPSPNDVINNLFGRALVEARVEGELQIDSDSWFISLKKILKRWWNYGSDGMKNPTGIVKFFDDDSPYVPSWTMPSNIRSLVPGGQTNNPGPGLAEDYKPAHGHYQAFMNKAVKPKKIPKELPGPNAPSLDMFGLFGKAKEILEMPVPPNVPGMGMI